VSLGARVFSTVDGRARAIETIRDIERNSVDQYAGMRDAYIRHRQDQVDNLTPQDLGIDPEAN
jgi:ABC-type transporter lipoprotein component MlaA